MQAYQRAASSVAANHRKLGAEFSKTSPYQTMCFGTKAQSYPFACGRMATNILRRAEIAAANLGHGIPYLRL
jgi:hypothetical protein